MNPKTIFNPFEKFDEKHLLIIGILFFVLNIFGCYYSGLVNDSIFHYSELEKNQNIWDILKINGISYAFAIAVLFILGKILNGKTRIIDIINTVLISQIVLQTTTPVNGLPFFRESVSKITENAGKIENVPMADLALVSIWGFVTLIILIYSFVLYYNGFKTATNIKKWQHIALFAFVSFVLIILSQSIL